MAGVVRGKIEIFLASTNFSSGISNGILSAQMFFKNIYDFCITHSNMTLIARQGGSAGTTSSVDFYDGTNPFLQNAWFVVRMNSTTSRAFPWYMLCQYWRSDQGSFGASPGNPGLCEGSATPISGGIVGVQFAIGIGGTQNPWNGAGTFGLNTKGATVWTTPPSGGTGVIVFPRSNNLGGTHVTNKENCTRLYGKNTVNPARCHILADDDSIVFATDQSDTNTYDLTYFGLYSTRTGLAGQVTYPMVHFSNSGFQLPFITTQIYGSTTGAQQGSVNNPQPGAGIPARNPITQGVAAIAFDRYGNAGGGAALTTASQVQPNKYFATSPASTWDEFPYTFTAFDQSLIDGGFGLPGQTELVREVSNLFTHELVTSGTRMVIGGQDPRSLKTTIPWDGYTVPKSGILRTGSVF